MVDFVGPGSRARPGIELLMTDWFLKNLGDPMLATTNKNE